jgi:predicted transglutaminase-like cysteine proteinase
MFAFVKIARIFSLVAICCSIAFADARPSRFFAVPEPDGGKTPDVQFMPENKSGDLAMLQLDSLKPNLPDRDEGALQSREPFDLSATMASSGEMSTKWTELQSRILADERTLAACRSGDDACPQAARRFLSIVELGRQHHGRARLAWVNRAVNLSIRPMSDWAQYGYADFWASPLTTLGSGAGDCEDYAIVKYVALRELGTIPDDLRLVIVRDTMRETDHEVVAVRNDQEWLILDNRTMATINAETARHYYPLFVMDYRGVRTFSTAAGHR